MYKEIKSIEDVKLLQEDLNAIYHWCECNLMLLNENKCVHIKFTKKINVLSSKYFVNGVALKECKEVRDLGVIVDCRLSFVGHVDAVVRKSFQMLGFIKRTSKHFSNVHTMLTLYNALVRSILEYATPAWNPQYQVHINRVESVQRSFTRFLAYKDRQCPYRADYHTRLSHFKLSKLETRRKIFDLKFLYNCLHGLVDVPNVLSQLRISVPRTCPRQPVQNTFSISGYRTNVGKCCPVNRFMTTYNGINTRDIDIFHDSAIKFKRCTESIIANA